MQDARPNITVVIDKRYESKEQPGKYPAKIRVTFKMTRGGKSKWVQKMFPGGCMVTQEEFERIIKNERIRQGTPLAKYRDELLKLEAKANEVAAECLSPDTFEARFTGSGNRSSVIEWFQAYEEELLKNNQVGTQHNVYAPARNSIKKFGGEYLTFSEITPKWLQRYEKEMLSMGKSVTVISIYLRALRTIYNQAIAAKYIGADLYPFGRNGYRIPTMTGTKWAPSDKERTALLNYQTNDLWIRERVDYFLFSYYCSVMNPADIAGLRFPMMDDKFITLSRTKTKSTERNIKPIRIPILQEARDIMNRWGKKSLNPNDYVFHVLKSGMTPKQIKNATQDWIKSVNKALKRVSEELELQKKLTFGIARHMYTTTLRRKGIPTEYIQQQLGHATSRTTEIYFHGFEDETSIENANLLRSNVS